MSRCVQENIRDLLIADATAQPAVHIREVAGGGVCLAGAQEQEVGSQADMAAILEQVPPQSQGALARPCRAGLPVLAPYCFGRCAAGLPDARNGSHRHEPPLQPQPRGLHHHAGAAASGATLPLHARCVPAHIPSRHGTSPVQLCRCQHQSTRSDQLLLESLEAATARQMAVTQWRSTCVPRCTWYSSPPANCPCKGPLLRVPHCMQPALEPPLSRSCSMPV